MYKKRFRNWKWRKNNRRQHTVLEIDQTSPQQEIQIITPTDEFQRIEVVLICASNYIDSLGLQNERQTYRNHFTSSLLGSENTTSWQTVNNQSGALLISLKDGIVKSSLNTFHSMLRNVEYALKVHMDANLMIKFWRICRDLIDASILAKDRELNFVYAFLRRSVEAVHGMMKRGEVAELNIRQCHLLRLLQTLLKTPKEEISFLFSQTHLRSIHKLQEHIGREKIGRDHFAILQMSTNYLTAWDHTLPELFDLPTGFKNLIDSASHEYGPDSMKAIMSMHQYLFYAWEILRDPLSGEDVAAELQSRARNNLQHTFDGIMRAFVHSTRVLMICCVADGRLGQATQYLNLATFYLDRGDEECHRRIKILHDNMKDLLSGLSTICYSSV